MAQEQKADVLLLAAGQGERLRPLTDSIPKPLVEVAGKPLIVWNFQLLQRAGFSNIFVNAHYLKDVLRTYLERDNQWGLSITVVEEEVLLGTGGAIKNIEDQLQHQQLITLNSDVVLGPDFDLPSVLEAHCNRIEKPKLTLVLREDIEAERFGAFGVDGDGRICSFLDTTYVDNPIEKRLMYTGVQVIERSVLASMPEKGTPFAIPEVTYRKLLSDGEFVQGIEYAGYWNDAGTPDRLEQASKDVARIFGIS